MPAIDDFVGRDASGPATNAVAVTPDDNTDLTHVSRALVATVAGVANVVMLGGQTTAIQLAAGIPMPIRVSRVKATSTTATGIVNLW